MARCVFGLGRNAVPSLKKSKTNVAVVGVGYWGKNLVRNFYDLGALAVLALGLWPAPVLDAMHATTQHLAQQILVSKVVP